MKNMKKMKLKKGDDIVVIAGKDRGKQGKIVKINLSANKVVVTGINIVKKAVKPNGQTGENGGIISKEAPIHASNVMLFDIKLQRSTRKRVAG